MRSARGEVLGEVERALGVLGWMEDGEAEGESAQGEGERMRVGIGEVQGALERAREILYGRRWI